MHKKIIVCLTGMIFMTIQAGAEVQQPLTSQKEKISYGVGVDLVRNFKRQGIEIDLDMVIKGMREEVAGKKLLLSDPELRKILADYQGELKLKQAKLKQQTAEKNKKTSAEFFVANKLKEGVVSLPSGLQYKILKAGDGKKPVDTDSVTCRYRGTLVDGAEFDSSDRIGYPVTFYVKDSVVPGWSEALKLMPTGSKWQVFVPPHLGYGEKGAGRDIEPNATLIYEIDLIAVNPEPVRQKKKD